mmetsp:Transcript_12582/g.49025  ORF Transcript_12582/g.49025 Transcript_12582/m.49025 type:complete len:329 (-) Transcript_12582:598-1584(-)
MGKKSRTRQTCIGIRKHLLRLGAITCIAFSFPALLVYIRDGWFCFESEMVHVVLASDRVHWKGTLAAINSVYRNTICPSKVHFHVFGVVIKLRYEFRKARMEFQPLPNLVSYVNRHYDPGKYPRGNLLAESNYLRFVLPSVISQKACWWLDSDVIVQGDIVRLTRSLKKSSPVAAFARARVSYSQAAFQELQSRGIEVHNTSSSFSAGVMYVNLEAWRRAAFETRLLQISRVHREVPLWSDFGSQPPLQLLIGDDFETIPSEHMIDGLGHKKVVAVDPKVTFLHWSGLHKPWLPDGKAKGYWSPYFQKFQNESSESLFQDIEKALVQS